MTYSLMLDAHRCADRARTYSTVDGNLLLAPTVHTSTYRLKYRAGSLSSQQERNKHVLEISILFVPTVYAKTYSVNYRDGRM